MVKVTSIILFLLLISNFRIGNADVALDVGHLYKSPGAISVSGVPEILYNKEVAEKVKEVVLLTDLDDEGKKLYHELFVNLQKHGVKVDNRLRELLFKSDLRQIEGLPSYLETIG